MNMNVIEPIAAEGDVITDEKAYTFRKLEAPDVFLMFKILGKIGINEFAECFGKESVQKMFGAMTGRGDLTQTMGVAVTLEIVNVVIGNLPKCENEIFQMLSNTSNLSADQVRKLDLPTFTAMVIDFVRKEEFKDFIKVVSESFK